MLSTIAIRMTHPLSSRNVEVSTRIDALGQTSMRLQNSSRLRLIISPSQQHVAASRVPCNSLPQLNAGQSHGALSYNRRALFHPFVTLTLGAWNERGQTRCLAPDPIQPVIPVERSDGSRCIIRAIYAASVNTNLVGGRTLVRSGSV